MFSLTEIALIILITFVVHSRGALTLPFTFTELAYMSAIPLVMHVLSPLSSSVYNTLRTAMRRVHVRVGGKAYVLEQEALFPKNHLGCVICNRRLHQYNEPLVTLLPCKHTVHKACFQDYASAAAQLGYVAPCPTCDVPVQHVDYQHKQQ